MGGRTGGSGDPRSLIRFPVEWFCWRILPRHQERSEVTWGCAIVLKMAPTGLLRSACEGGDAEVINRKWHGQS
jgi:hypothetical protein